MTNTEIKDFREFKTLEDQKRFFENLQLKPLENFIKEQFGIRVKFKKTILVRHDIEKAAMSLESQDIKNSTGALKHTFKKVTLATFGSISFYVVTKDSVGCQAEFQELSFPDITFSYEFTNGGYNGHDCIYVKYDLAQRNWYFKSCKDNYSMTYATSGQYSAYEEAYEQDRQIEIKEV